MYKKHVIQINAHIMDKSDKTNRKIYFVLFFGCSHPRIFIGGGGRFDVCFKRSDEKLTGNVVYSFVEWKLFLVYNFFQYYLCYLRHLALSS